MESAQAAEEFTRDVHGLLVRFVLTFIVAKIRAEVLHRVAQQKEIVQTSGGTADVIPYLMLLVRPEGIPAYYQFQSALRGMEVRYGYEFIDSDWILDFPADDNPAGSQPWTTVARSNAGGKTTSTPASPRGVVGLRPNGVPLAPDGGNGAQRLLGTGPGPGGGRAGPGVEGSGSGGSAGLARKSRWASAPLTAASAFSVPSSTGMPASASSWARASWRTCV